MSIQEWLPRAQKFFTTISPTEEPCLCNNNNNNNNNKPISNAPDASVTGPEARRTLRDITVRVDH